MTRRSLFAMLGLAPLAAKASSLLDGKPKLSNLLDGPMMTSWALNPAIGYQCAIAIVARRPGLPDVFYPPGQIIFNAMDGKLYRNANGVGWLCDADVMENLWKLTELRVDGARI